MDLYWIERTNRLAVLDSPRLAERLGPQPIGFGVVHEFMFFEVVGELAIKRQRDVRRMAGDVGEAGRVGVRLRLTAGLHASEKVADVERRRIAVDLSNRSPGQ